MRLDSWEDFSFDVDREEIEMEGAEAFIDANPQFYQSEWNAEILVAWCRQRKVPTTRLNLTLAFQELKKEGLLEVAPARPVITVRQNRRPDGFIEALSKDSAAELAALKKLADDPMQSDQTRKKRDAALKKLAIASRIAHRQGPSLRGSEQIVI